MPLITGDSCLFLTAVIIEALALIYLPLILLAYSLMTIPSNHPGILLSVIGLNDSDRRPGRSESSINLF